MTSIGQHNIAFLDPEDLNKDVLQSFPVIFDVKILLKNWPARQPTKISLATHTGGLIGCKMAGDQGLFVVGDRTQNNIFSKTCID